MKSYRYSSWDGTQDISAVDADDLMDAMADELTSHGDLNQALRNLMRRGMRGNMGSGFEGIRELIERLKQQSRERLERYNLASLVDEFKKRLEDILQMERTALDPQRPASEQGAAGQEGDAPAGLVLPRAVASRANVVLKGNKRAAAGQQAGQQGQRGAKDSRGNRDSRATRPSRGR